MPTSSPFRPARAWTAADPRPRRAGEPPPTDGGPLDHLDHLDHLERLARRIDAAIEEHTPGHTPYAAPSHGSHVEPAHVEPAHADSSNGSHRNPSDPSDPSHSGDPAGPSCRSHDGESSGPEERSGPERVPHLLIAVTENGSGTTIGFRALAGHPLAALAGEVAPSEWRAIGVSGRGWAEHVVDDRSRSSHAAGRWPVRALHLVERSGASVMVVRAGRAAPTVRTSGAAELTPLGQIDDCLRRTLGLPTAPPPASIREAIDLAWLERILTGAVGGVPTGNEWSDVLPLHPLFDPAVDDLVGSPRAHRLRRLAIDELGPATSALAVEVRWSDLHEQARSGSSWLVGVRPELARWMDVGVYARLVLQAFPERRDLLGDLAALLDRDLHQRLVRTTSGSAPSR